MYNYINELSNKLTDIQIKSSLIVFDNSTCHKAQEVIQNFIDKKFKIITNIPYKIEFNGIEFLFGFFKNEYYKGIHSNKKEQKKKIIELIESNEIKEKIESFYLQVYEKNLNDLLKKNKEEKVINLYEYLKNKSEDDLSKNFDE
jgi:hydroxypyruvate isomerase